MKKYFFTIFLVLGVVGVLSSQSEGITINTIEIQFTGKARTGERVLRSYIDIKEGDQFSSLAELETDIEEQIRELNNTRYFNSVEMSAEETDQQGEYKIILVVEDGWTLVPIPYPLPDSAVGLNGWSFGLEVNYDNFFGTMTDFYFDGYANLAFGEEEKLKAWKLKSKIKNIKIGNLKHSVEFQQEYKTTADTDPAKPEELQVQQHYTNYSSEVGVSTSFRLSNLWTYSITPKLGFKYEYDYHDTFEGDTVKNNESVIEDPFYFSFNHSIKLGRVDWVGPLRKGYEVSLSNSLGFLNSYYRDTDTEEFRFVPELTLTGKSYIPFLKHFNYYTKGEVYWGINNIKTGLGSKLRGVKNSSMSGDFGFFWLNTLAIEIWGNDTFHIQLHPFTDMGFALKTEEVNSLADNFRIGFGTELIGMIGSVDLKAKYGYDQVSDYHDFSFVTGFSY
ncbi:MAG: POTRA domain-containing protein [Spirochaetia bacterium]